MSFFKDLIGVKYWLTFGSVVGAALCVIIMHVAEMLPQETPITLGLPMGFTLSISLGMIGGIIGGIFGSLIGGTLAGEDVFLNIGVSLGIGSINGFITGTLTGVIIGLMHKFEPAIISHATMFMLAAAVIVLATVVGIIKKKR